jgi:hypothetical protein
VAIDAFCLPLASHSSAVGIIASQGTTDFDDFVNQETRKRRNDLALFVSLFVKCSIKASYSFAFPGSWLDIGLHGSGTQSLATAVTNL